LPASKRFAAILPFPLLTTRRIPPQKIEDVLLLGGGFGVLMPRAGIGQNGDAGVEGDDGDL